MWIWGRFLCFRIRKITAEESSRENKSKSKPLQHELHRRRQRRLQIVLLIVIVTTTIDTLLYSIVKLALHWVQYAIKDFDPKVKPVCLR